MHISRLPLPLFLLPLLVIVAFTTSGRSGDVNVTLDAGSGFVVQDREATFERFRVDEATGNFSRNGALFVHTTGANNTFVGEGAGNLLTTGDFNSGFGKDALRSNTTGGSNSAFGVTALSSNTTGGSNSAFGGWALHSNTTSDYNSAFGDLALFSNTTGGSNSAFGSWALRSNSRGTYNSAFGDLALFSNITGDSNSGFGDRALFSNTTGTYNSAFGGGALSVNDTGSFNSSFGDSALLNNTTGTNNVAVGHFAGFNQTTGNYNIYLANNGVAGESGQIKIGNDTDHTQAMIAGIHGNPVSSGINVLVNASGFLGTTVSSARFKQQVRDMGSASEVVMALRPVTFHYRKEVAEGDAAPQYGLIAEEVAEVAPELVVLDAEGKPYSVRYHVLPSLLLNEVQNQHRELQKQKQVIAALETRLAQLEQVSSAE